MGLLLQGSAETTNAARNRQRIPYFSDETVCCPALIPGDSGDSGHNPRSDARGETCPFFRRFPNDFGRTIRWHHGFAFKVDYGRFLESRLFSGCAPFSLRKLVQRLLGVSVLRR